MASKISVVPSPGIRSPSCREATSRRDGAADEAARSHPTLDQPLVLEVAQGPGDGRPRDAEPLHELRLAGQATRRAVLPGGDLGEQFPRDPVMLRFGGHRQPAPNNRAILS